MTLDDVFTVGDKYARATHSSNLTPSLRGQTDADVLLAAGAAAHGNERMSLALDLYRMRVNGDMRGLLAVAHQMEAWLKTRMHVKGGRPMSRIAREALITQTMQWWIAPTCPFCAGHGFVPAEDAPRLTLDECVSCFGKGHRPLAREVPHQLVAHAQWMVDQLDRRVAEIHERMARLLSLRMDV